MFPLHPDTPEAGLSLEDLFHVDSDKIGQMISQLQQMAHGLGLAFGDRRMTYNSRLAQELGIWAAEQGKGYAYDMTAFTAYFGEGQNLAKHNVLLEIVKQAGLDQETAKQILTDRSYSSKVDRDWQLSRNLGIKAAPTFVMGDSRLIGAQPYQALRGLVLGNSSINSA